MAPMAETPLAGTAARLLRRLAEGSASAGVPLSRAAPGEQGNE